MSDEKRQVTPTGEAKWAHLHTPKAAFMDEQGHAKGDPKFQIDVYFSKDDPAWAVWATDLMSKVKAIPDQVDKRSGEVLKKQSPIKRELDEADQPTGRFYVTFKTSDKFKPGVFDRYGNPLAADVLVGNGSKVCVSYSPNTYLAFGGGINFYLNAVQVIELVEYKNQSAEAYGFAVESDPVVAANRDPGSDDANPFDDDVLIPF